MSILLAANNAESQLAAGISAVALTAQLTPGTGVLFPAPTAGQYFKLTFLDAASTQLREIVHVTNVTGDTITMIRGQEGTTAKAYLAGDIAGELFTAGSFQALVQAEQLQTGAYTKASAVGGTGNAITATLPSTLTALVDGLTILVPATAANTAATAIVVTLGTTAQPSKAIVKPNNTALTGGEIPGAGFPMVLIYSTTYGAFVLNAVASGFLSNAVGVAINDAAGAQRFLFGSGAKTSMYGAAAAGQSGIDLVVNGSTVLQAKDGGIVSIGADAVASGDVPRLGQVQTLVNAAKLVSGTVVNVSSPVASLAFTGIPAGVKEITIAFAGLSLSGTSEFLFRIGTSGGVVVTGYFSYFGSLVSDTNAGTAGSTSGFGVSGSNPTSSLHGAMTLSLMDASTNKWVSVHTAGETGTGSVKFGGGSIALASALTQIQIVSSNGTDNIDAGSMNIIYKL